MNRPPLSAALPLALLAIGCGGSSISSQSTNTSAGVALGTPSVEAVLVPNGSNPSYNPLTPVPQDSMNIEIGQVVQFQLVAYDAKGGRHILTTGPWRDSDTNSLYGILDVITGQFASSNVPTSSVQTVGAVYNNFEYTSNFQLLPTQAIIVGKVVSSNGGGPVANVGIEFFAVDGTRIGTEVHTGYDGTFRASTPTTVAGFTIDPNSVGSAFWQSYTWYGQTYDADDATTYGTFYTSSGGNLSPSQDNNLTWTFYNRQGQPTSYTAGNGENFMFAVTQPSSLFTPIVPQSSSDPGLIVLNSRVTYPTKPVRRRPTAVTTDSN